MAKQNSNAVRRIQSDVPEAHRPMVRISDDGTRVFVTLNLSRYADVSIRKTQKERVDRAKIRPDRYNESYCYGEGRKLRDGAATKDEKGKALDAKAILAAAIGHAQGRIEWLYGLREGKATQSGVDTVTRECRKLFIKFACKNLADSKGNRYTGKSLPSALVTARDIEAAKSEAKRIGIPPKKIAAHVQRATKIAALIDDDTDMVVKV